MAVTLVRLAKSKMVYYDFKFVLKKIKLREGSLDELFRQQEEELRKCNVQMAWHR